MKSSRRFKIICIAFLLLFASSCATSNNLSRSPQLERTPQKVSTIQGISFVEEENYTRIRIEGSETITPPFYKLLSDPLRIVIDVPNIDLKQIRGPVQIDNGTIGRILTTQYDDKGRIEIGLTQTADYNILKEDKNLIVDIEKVKRVAEVKEVREVKEAKEVKGAGEVKEVKKEEETAKGKGTEISPAESPPPPSSPAEPTKESTVLIQPVAVAPTPEPANKAREIVNFLLEQKEDFVTFKIIADGKLGNYDSLKLDSPARLVLDIWEVSTRYPQKSIKFENPFIKEVRIGLHPDKLRLVFYPTKPQLPPYQINRIDHKLIVSLGKVPQPSGSQILVQEKSPEGISPPQAKDVSVTPPQAQGKAPSEGSMKTTKASSLTEIDFKQMDDKSRIVSVFTEEPKFESRMISKNTIAVDIKNAFVPKHLQRGLDTSEFDSAVTYISMKNVKVGKSSDVRILIRLREEMPFETTQEGKTLFIDIARPKRVEAKKETGPSVEAKGAEIKTEEEKPIPELKKAEKGLPPPEEKPVSPLPVAKRVEEEKRAAEEGLPGKVYTGRKLSLDFKDADIKNILRLIAEVSNLNIIAGDDVTGKLTMRLVDVPWDQALDVILQARSLGMTRVGNVIRVAPLDTLKREVQTELEAKRAKERLEDLVTELIPVNYATAKDIIPQTKGVLSDRGDVRADERTNTLIIKDIPRNIAGVKNLVKALDTKTPQVLIEARIVEANLTFQRDLGVKWGFLAQGGNKIQAGGGTSDTILGTAVNNVVNLPAAPTTGTAGILELLFTGTHGIKQLDLAISAAESTGEVRIISSPKIATLDNKEASIEQGLRIPYPKLTTEGTITTDFIEANLKLTVTPHVTNDGNIKMSIKAKKDAPVFNTAQEVLGVPPIDKKEAITEVLVKDNGVVVIAGIYTVEKDSSSTGIPLFSKIPLLGWLFKSETKADTRKDLLIFISPKIIKDQL